MSTYTTGEKITLGGVVIAALLAIGFAVFVMVPMFWFSLKEALRFWGLT